MKLFLDSSVVLAACGSATGASRLLFAAAQAQSWELQTSAYVVNEVTANLPRLGEHAGGQWKLLQPSLKLQPDFIIFPWITVFSVPKDRPILLTAAAWSDVLLTLDRRDFAELLGTQFYSLPILTPADFLRRERDSGRWFVSP